LALSNKSEKRYFYLSSMSNLGTFHPLESRKDTMKKIEIDAMDVVSFLKNKKLPNLIRMDVEGHEVEILESLIEAIKLYNFYPLIIFEPHK
ncbi:MAG TPA: hypothetical protein DHV62_05415, partial [Elusimicrobia bacterium]|nr:hypothetical protein [Elusimicrobiota bacterium]